MTFHTPQAYRWQQVPGVFQTLPVEDSQFYQGLPSRNQTLHL